MKLLKLKEHLEEALHFANMTNANFGRNDELIKKESKLFRETWLVPNIRQALELVEEEINKKKRK